MAKIFKYQIHLPETEIEIPDNSAPLCVQMQNGQPHVWIIHHDLEAPKKTIKFTVIGTGHEFKPQGAYLGTFQVYEGSLIFHVFYEANLKQ